ncbi:hypothetical protein [Paenibacillus mucilaginosus]|uniref:hypothetical protein n=1 Tax=Paenibacillus mucilaginosus TaxID=61624 RepID=UPI001F2732B5|nr:hypothetical protein [Paenibacillus mucilaginosus]
MMGFLAGPYGSLWAKGKALVLPVRIAELRFVMWVVSGESRGIAELRFVKWAFSGGAQGIAELRYLIGLFSTQRGPIRRDSESQFLYFAESVLKEGHSESEFRYFLNRMPG